MASCNHCWQKDYDEQVCLMCGQRLYPDPDSPKAALRPARIASEAFQEERKHPKRKSGPKPTWEATCHARK